MKKGNAENYHDPIYGPMFVQEAREHLARLGWTQGDFARFFECGDRTARRWLSPQNAEPMPRGVAFVLRELTPAKAKKWMPE